MNSQNTDDLAELLHAFNAVRLGEGNLAAGANVLAAMACAIADIHRNGTCFRVDGGEPYRVGCSLLAYGPLSSTLISERVCSVLAEYQSRMNMNVSEWHEAKKDTEDSLNGRRNERFIIEANVANMYFMRGNLDTMDHDMSTLILPSLSGKKRLLTQKSLLYTSSGKPSHLGAALQRSHLGQILVHDSLRDPAQCVELASTCLPLIDGSLSVGEGFMPVRGHLLLCDRQQVLDEALHIGSDAKRLMLRIPWLVDSNAGPDMPVPDDSAISRPVFDCVEERFKMALSSAWQYRTDFKNGSSCCLEYDISKYQESWIAYLREREENFPGITAAARSLLPSLLFGFYEMTEYTPAANKPVLKTKGVEALARLLIQRMCNVRAIILHDSAREHRERKLRTMFEKLSESGTSTLRQLVRKHHRLPVDEARGLLNELVLRRMIIDLGEDRYEVGPIDFVNRAPALILEA